MSGRQVIALAAFASLILLLTAGGAYYVLREQRAANAAILAKLDSVQSALGDEARRSRELAGQVSALTERVAGLERDNRDLRRRLAALLSRKPAEVASLPLLLPLELAPLVPYAPPMEAAAPAVMVETLPITWATEWTSYQPAGLIAPSPSVVLSRKLADPAFLKTMYVSYGALQIADIASTLSALDGGRGREANPFMGNVAGNPAALIGVKAATSVMTIMLMEKVRKTHPVAASVSMIAINATMAAIVVNNTRVAARP